MDLQPQEPMPAAGRRRPGRPRKTDASPNSTRQTLVEAATAAFAASGYEGVTLNEIMSRARYTTGALYKRFGGKTELLLESVSFALSKLWLHTPAREQPCFVDMVHDVIPAWTQLSRVERVILAEIHLAASRNEDVGHLLGEELASARASWSAGLQADKEQGKLRADADVDAIAAALLLFSAGLNHLDTVAPELLGDGSLQDYLTAWLVGLLEMDPPRARSLP